MMQVIHNKVKGLFATIIISLIILTFIMWGAQGYIMARAQRNYVAVINGTEIKDYQFQRRYQNVIMQFMNQYGDGVVNAPGFKDRIKQNLLREMVTHELLRQASENLGLRIGDEQLSNIIERMPVFQEDGKFSPEKFQAVMATQGSNSQKMLADLQENLIRYQLRSVFTLGAFSLEEEVQRAMELRNETRDIRYIYIKPDSQPIKTMPTDEEMKQFYERQKESFAIPEKAKVEYLVLDAAEMEKQVAISDAKAKQYYEENLVHYKKPKRWHIAQLVIGQQNGEGKKRLKEVQEKLKAGKSFSDVAKQYSDDLITKEQGGDLGWLTENMLTKDMKTALDYLSQDSKQDHGGISEPFVSPQGYTLIQLKEVKEESVKPYAKVKDKIVQDLKRQRVQKQFSDEAEQLANLTFSNPDTLSIAAEALRLKPQQTQFFTAEKGIDEVTNLTQVRQAAFADDVIGAGNNSDLIQLTPQRVMVLRVIGHEPKTYTPFEKVMPMIKAELMGIAKRRHAKAVAESLRDTINEDKSVDNDLKDYRLKWEPVANLTRTEQKYPKPFMDAAFNVAQGKSTSVVLANGEAYVINVQTIKPGQSKPMKPAEKKVFFKSLAEEQGHMAYQLYENYLREKAKIEINQEALQSIH